MLHKVIKRVFGTSNERFLKSVQPILETINSLESSISKLSDAELKNQTFLFRERLTKGESLEKLLPEAFATVREASKRVLGQRHYDVQLIGGYALHQGRIAEMRTGEGKTLTATAPVYLNALTGKGVHVITVNDYLAKRDCEQMGKLYRFLGLSTGVIVHGLSDTQRKLNYAADISYGTNNEFGFDYLRDNMKFRLEDYVQREHHYAIVDEVDSILIDEARTPLIISGPAEKSSGLYYEIDGHVRQGGGLVLDVDYTVDEKARSASLTEAGIEKLESRMKVQNLYDPRNLEMLHHVNQALRAHVIFKRDVDYVIRDREIIIVDEFTGRLMPGRRWSDGLHQAIEAKEGVEIENENQTLATITFQNYFRMYKKLAGMTGTADTEATEFKQIYNLEVTVIPTNKPMVRKDHADIIFKGQSGKFKAAVEEIKRLREKGQPVLVGTASVEKSELLHQLLTKEQIPHAVLNAKQHEREAYVIAQAGRKSAVTISTNMAGRGTDILLGGQPDLLALDEVGRPKPDATPAELAEYETLLENKKIEWQKRCAGERLDVVNAGGLFILGTERHESRRIDNQLRGRSGRQGDPGESRFYLSFEDDLLRIFGHSMLLQKTVAAMEEDQPIESSLTTRAIENAQKKVEGHNYDIRKHLLEYDDVMNQQRQVVYSLRREVLSQQGLRDIVFSMVEDIATNISQIFFPNGRLKKNDQGIAFFDKTEMDVMFSHLFQTQVSVEEKEVVPFNDQGLKKWIMAKANSIYTDRENSMGDETVRHLEKMILLTTIDQLWKDHLLAMDHLRDGIGLQGYGQKDPLVAYKKEGFRYFQMMMEQIYGDVTRRLFGVQVTSNNDISMELEAELERKAAEQNELPMTFSKPELTSSVPASQPRPMPRMESPPNPMGSGSPFLTEPLGAGAAIPRPTQPMYNPDKIGRNDPCPCGSGKKFKKCHGM